MMGTPTRRMTARSRISSWGGGRGRGEGRQAQRGLSVPRATQHTARSLPKLPHPPSPRSSLLAVHCGPRGPRRDTPGYIQGTVRNPPPATFPRATAANLGPECTRRNASCPSPPCAPRVAPVPLLCFPHCTPARSRPPPTPSSPSPVPLPTKERDREEAVGRLGTAVGVGTHRLPFSPVPNKREGSGVGLFIIPFLPCILVF